MIYSNFLINSIQFKPLTFPPIKFKLTCFEIKIERTDSFHNTIYFMICSSQLNENSFIKMSNRIFSTIQFCFYLRRQFRIKIPLSLRCSISFFFSLFFLFSFLFFSFFFFVATFKRTEYYQMTSNIGVHKNLTRTSVNINASVLVLNDRDDYCREQRGERCVIKNPIKPR